MTWLSVYKRKPAARHMATCATCGNRYVTFLIDGHESHHCRMCLV